MDTVALPDWDAHRLAVLEETVAAGMQTFVEVGTALAEIRDSRLYRAEHATFEDYCERRWSLRRSRAYQLIDAAAVVVSTMVDTVPELPAPANERQARELARVEPERRAEVWQRAVEDTGGRPTAAAVREAAAPVLVPEIERPDPQTQATDYLARFPELAYYAERGRTADLLRLGGALDGYDEPELTMRRRTLAKSIEADKRRQRGVTTPSRHPDWSALARQMFQAANEASKVIARSGGAEAFTRSLPLADPITAENWQAQFTELAETCRQIAETCKTTKRLRRIQ